VSFATKPGVPTQARASTGNPVNGYHRLLVAFVAIPTMREKPVARKKKE
jgi:hypothetical protein